jgi:tetratricopeptide (TPR) repeat protein
MQLANQTSGNLAADRRAEFARHYARSGDHAAAAEVIAQALELAPGHLAFLSLQGEWLDKAGRAADAAEVWAQMLRLDAGDRFGAQLKLANLGLTETPTRRLRLTSKACSTISHRASRHRWSKSSTITRRNCSPRRSSRRSVRGTGRSATRSISAAAPV